MADRRQPYIDRLNDRSVPSQLRAEILADDVDRRTGAPNWWLRHYLSTIPDDNDRLKTLKKYHPEAFQNPDRPHEFVIYNPNYDFDRPNDLDNKPLMVLDPSGLEGGDFAEWAASIPGVTGGVVGGGVGFVKGGPIGSWAGGALGAEALQQIYNQVLLDLPAKAWDGEAERGTVGKQVRQAAINVGVDFALGGITDKAIPWIKGSYQNATKAAIWAALQRRSPTQNFETTQMFTDFKPDGDDVVKGSLRSRRGKDGDLVYEWNTKPVETEGGEIVDMKMEQRFEDVAAKYERIPGSYSKTQKANGHTVEEWRVAVPDPDNPDSFIEKKVKQVSVKVPRKTAIASDDDKGLRKKVQNIREHYHIDPDETLYVRLYNPKKYQEVAQDALRRAEQPRASTQADTETTGAPLGADANRNIVPSNRVPENMQMRIPSIGVAAGDPLLLNYEQRVAQFPTAKHIYREATQDYTNSFINELDALAHNIITGRKGPQLLDVKPVETDDLFPFEPKMMQGVNRQTGATEYFDTANMHLHARDSIRDHVDAAPSRRALAEDFFTGKNEWVNEPEIYDAYRKFEDMFNATSPEIQARHGIDRRITDTDTLTDDEVRFIDMFGPQEHSVPAPDPSEAAMGRIAILGTSNRMERLRKMSEYKYERAEDMMDPNTPVAMENVMELAAEWRDKMHVAPLEGTWPPRDIVDAGVQDMRDFVEQGGTLLDYGRMMNEQNAALRAGRPSEAMRGARKQALDWIDRLLADRQAGDGYLPLDQFRQMRSDLWHDIDRSRFGAYGAATEKDRYLQQLYRAMTEDRNDTIRQHGGEAAVEALRDADAFYAKRMQVADFVDDLQKDGNEVAAFNFVMQGSKKGGQRLREFFRNLPPDFRDAFRTSMVMQMGRYDPETEDLFEKFSSRVWLTNIGNMNKEARDVLFGKDTNRAYRKDVDTLVKFATDTKKVDLFENFSRTGDVEAFTYLLSPVIGGASVSVATGDLMPVVAGAGGSILVGVAAHTQAQMMTSPEMMKWFAGLAKRPKMRINPGKGFKGSTLRSQLVRLVSIAQNNPELQVPIIEYIEALKRNMQIITGGGGAAQAAENPYAPPPPQARQRLTAEDAQQWIGEMTEEERRKFFDQLAIEQKEKWGAGLRVPNLRGIGR